ncbi:hypothetical protein LYSHEL_28660 [Lysobacter helvus]|uniref:Uncharacterized protein n=2 Tax=Lysobacteraceae TaxID=32033 RepID=A0ABN6FY30_9GAMM|nr:MULTISPECIES: hypothetical protein [Lysobacter]BCT93839.1 hypothetical protein LYSCAS_28630 [Lysobacter caseinilyticus]BCT96995.1 hypothetical protein LYSHEL_28660 [Lysobacter helvus]
MRHAKPLTLHACILTCGLGLALSAGPAVAKDPPKPDLKVTAQLDAAGMSYQVDEEGDYKMVFEMEDKRTQVVFLRAPVETFGKRRIREIWSPAYKAEADGQVPMDVANRLLDATMANKIGAWAAEGDVAVFVVKIDADAPAAELRETIEAAADTADAMENELTPGKDDF